MSAAVPPMLVDCSVVIKWKLTSEAHAPEARELYLDWEHDAVKVHVPDQLFTELASALLRISQKRPARLTVAEARDALEDLLSLPFSVYKTTGRRLPIRAFEIALDHTQRVYDCVYVALAEKKRIEFWTCDERLYNALHLAFPFIRRIADYTRKRP